jgi:RAB6A-GEF complex partner protein 1
MYWPLGTPRIYATSSSRQLGSLQQHTVSHDGLSTTMTTGRSEQRPDKLSLLSPGSAAFQDGPGTSSAPLPATAPLTPVTPITPLTPGIKPVEHGYLDEDNFAPSPGPVPANLPLHDAVLALRVARAGHIFAVITATSMTVWQTKVWASPLGLLVTFALVLSDVHFSQPLS